jgi:predicted site-specific integrase-resolvase
MFTITPPAPSPVLSADDAATFLGANVRTLERWRHIGEGPVFVKIGRRVAYGLEDLELYLRQQRRASTAATSAPISPAA